MNCKAYTLWFYNPDAETTTAYNMVNKLVSLYSPPFCHVEMQFPNGEATSIIMNHTVSLRTRTFDPMHYEGLQFFASENLIQNAYEVAREKNKACVPFSMLSKSEGTYCTKLVWEILKHSGLSSHFDESTVDLLDNSLIIPPSLLFHTLKHHGKQIKTLPNPVIDFAF